MNGTVKKAYEMQQAEYKGYIPDLEIGEVCEINDLWDGDGDIPEDSFAVKIGDHEWINYSFDLIEEKENPLDTIIKITGIELL